MSSASPPLSSFISRTTMLPPRLSAVGLVLSISFFSAYVSASPIQDNVLRVPITKRSSGASFSAKAIVESDRARLAVINARNLLKRGASVAVTNADVSYTVNTQND